MLRKALALLLSCCASGPYVGTARTTMLGSFTFSIHMDGMEPDQKQLALYREGTQVCPEGFAVVSDQVDNHRGLLRGYVIIHCQ